MFSLLSVVSVLLGSMVLNPASGFHLADNLYHEEVDVSTEEGDFNFDFEGEHPMTLFRAEIAEHLDDLELDVTSEVYFQESAVPDSPYSIATYEVSKVSGLAGSSRGFRNGVGSSSKFNYPYGMDTYEDDGVTWVLVADWKNCMVRRINPNTGWTETLIGNNPGGDVDGSPAVQRIKQISAVKVAPNKKWLLISDQGSKKVKQYSLDDGGLYTVAKYPHFKFPSGIAISANSKLAYVADYDLCAVKVINFNVNPPTVSTLVGGKKGYADGVGDKVKFDGLESVTISPDGHYLYTSEYKNNVIRRITISTQTSITFAGKKGGFNGNDGIGTSAQFKGLGEISFHPDGNFFIVPDYYGHKIRRVVIGTRQVTTLAGSGSRGYVNSDDGSKAKFDGPYGATWVDNDHAVVSDFDGHKIRNIFFGQAPTPAPGSTAAPTPHCSNPDAKKYGYDFTFADGTRVSGTSDDNWVEVEVDGKTIDLHISCSDDFADGYGEKGGPVEGVNPRVTSFEIVKLKYPGSSYCKVDKTCSDVYPTAHPTRMPTLHPTRDPTRGPTAHPTRDPTRDPTSTPTLHPTTSTPTRVPTAVPTTVPSKVPTVSPTKAPTAIPTVRPTPQPTTDKPTESPVTSAPTVPTATIAPTVAPTSRPTKTPTSTPTSRPTSVPTSNPTKVPTSAPSAKPSSVPTASPSATPTKVPSTSPTATPSSVPTARPTKTPTSAPTVMPTGVPSKTPTPAPTATPTVQPTSTYGPTQSPTLNDCRNPPVMIRLDNVQSYWCSGIVVELVEEILALGFPINIGLIGNDGEPLTSDTYISENAEEWATNPLVEFANGGYSYTSYSGQALDFQINEIAAAKVEIQAATVSEDFPATFIPPNGDWDGNTITAIKSESMSIMSSYCIWDPENPGTVIWCPSGSNIKAPNVEVDGVCRLPAGAVLGGKSYWEDNSQPADLFSAVNWVWSQIDEQGFSVLQLKPIEFATDKRSCISMDEDKKKVLKDLLYYGKDVWDFSTFSHGCEYSSTPHSDSCPTPPPRPIVTASPTVSSTTTDEPTWSPVVVTSSPSLAPAEPESSAPTLPDCDPKPVVVFRMDNLEAFWCSDLATQVVQEFIDASVPLNVGLIGRQGLYECSDDVALSSAISDWQKLSTIEIVSNSHKFMYFDGETLEWQSEDLENGQAEIMEVANGYCPLSFIPPYGGFDENTFTAMKANHLDVMSSYCVWDLEHPGTATWCPSGEDYVYPNILNDGVYMLPAGAVLGDIDYWEDNSLPANFSSALAWIDEQIARQGFSVVSLSPIEFATDRDNCLGLDSDKVAVLHQLFEYARDNWDVQLFQEAKVTLSSPPDCTQSPTPAPSAKPSPAPTPIRYSPTPSPSSTPTSETISPTLVPTWDEECPGDVVTTYETRTEEIAGGRNTIILTTTVTTLQDKVITAYQESCMKSWTETEYTDGTASRSGDSSSTSGLAGDISYGSLFAIIFGCTTFLLMAYIAVGFYRSDGDNPNRPSTTEPSFSSYPSEMVANSEIAMKNPAPKKKSFTESVGGFFKRQGSNGFVQRQNSGPESVQLTSYHAADDEDQQL